MFKLWKSDAPPGEGANTSDRAEIEDLKAQYRSLEGRMKAIEQDWDVSFQKMRRLVGHVTKSRALDDALNIQQPSSQQQPRLPVEEPAPTPRRKSADELTRDEIAAMTIP